MDKENQKRAHTTDAEDNSLGQEKVLGGIAYIDFVILSIDLLQYYSRCLRTLQSLIIEMSEPKEKSEE